MVLEAGRVGRTLEQCHIGTLYELTVFMLQQRSQVFSGADGIFISLEIVIVKSIGRLEFGCKGSKINLLVSANA